MLKCYCNKKIKGFTLSELLLSLTIVGVIAVLTVPVLLSNIQKRLFTNQIKNMSAMIEQLAQDELISKKTRDLSNTDFADPEILLTDKHFAIIKTCSASASRSDCWKTEATGKDKVIYKNLSNDGTPNIYLHKTLVLKNGVMLSAGVDNGYGSPLVNFQIDINGNDKPNIAGRDLFNFFVDVKGNIISFPPGTNTLNEDISKCKASNDIFTPWFCYDALVKNNWQMDY